MRKFTANKYIDVNCEISQLASGPTRHHAASQHAPQPRCRKARLTCRRQDHLTRRCKPNTPAVGEAASLTAANPTASQYNES